MRVTGTFGLALLCASFLGQCQADNEYPIILMHGVTGWGRDELLGVKYWGGLSGDLQEDMKKRSGTEVYTVAMGPLSSNWDRVCEAFAQIKGTQVDYGIEHADTFEINRKGRDYTGKGLYPTWGDVDSETGMVKKVHLLGHSMGGMDARMLTHLLNKGAKEEQEQGDSELFSGDHDWIASVTTVATPHDGASAALLVDMFTSLVTALVGSATALFQGQVGSNSDPLFDFKLDQFGLTRNNGEKFNDYFGRVKKSALFNRNYKNTALWSLNPDGALATNEWVTCIEDVHYFSFGTSASFSPWWTKKHYPNPTQVLLLWPFSAYTGQKTRRGSATEMEITKEWFENDGVVSTKTADGPTGGTCQTEIYNGKTLVGQEGKFLNIGVKKGYDHLDITGLGLRPIGSFYSDIQNLVLGLKSSSPLECTSANGCEGSTWPKPPTGSFAFEATEEQIGVLTASALEPAPDGDTCQEINDVCGAEVEGEIFELCLDIKEANPDCFASGAASLAPVFGLVLAFANLLW